MKGSPHCPRCRGAVNPPGLWSDSWQCPLHGSVVPLHPPVQPTADLLIGEANRAHVPLWTPWPLPRGFVVTGMAHAGDDHSGTRATALALSGPDPLGGGMGEIVLVAEEPGIGLGASFAGMPGPDPGEAVDGPPHATVQADSRECPLWCVTGGADRAVYVGEAFACWLWLVFWPSSSAALLLEDLHLEDLRALQGEVAMLPFGALTPRLAAGSTAA